MQNELPLLLDSMYLKSNYVHTTIKLLNIIYETYTHHLYTKPPYKKHYSKTQYVPPVDSFMAPMANSSSTH